MRDRNAQFAVPDPPNEEKPLQIVSPLGFLEEMKEEHMMEISGMSCRA